MRLHSLRLRFILAAALLVVTTVVAGVWTSVALTRASRVVSRTVSESEQITAATTQLSGALEREDDALLLVLAGDDQVRQALSEARGMVDRAQRDLASRLQAAQDAERLRDTSSAIAAYRAAADRLAASTDAREALGRYHHEANPLLRRAVNAAAALRDRHFAAAREAVARARDETVRARRAALLITLAALIIAVAVAAHLTRAIVGPLRALTRGADAIRGGRFTERIDVPSRDELGALAAAFNEMAGDLAEFRRTNVGEMLRAKRALEATIEALPDAVLLLDAEARVISMNSTATGVLRTAGIEQPRTLADLRLDGLVPAAIAALIRASSASGTSGAHVANAANGKGRSNRADGALGADDASATDETNQTNETDETGGAGRADGTDAAGSAVAPAGADLTRTIRVDRQDGVRRLLPRVLPVPGLEDGRGGAVLVLYDVTDLARLDEMRSELVAVASHELQTPLTTLRMTLLMLQESAETLAHRQRELLATSLLGVEQLGDIVREFLDLTRIEAGQLRLDMAPLSIGALTEAAVRRAAPRAEAQAVALRTTVAPDLPVVPGDAVRLGAVLDNVLSNALQHTPAQGTITIEVSDGGAGRRGRAVDQHDRRDRRDRRELGDLVDRADQGDRRSLSDPADPAGPADPGEQPDRDERGVSIAITDTGPGVPAASRGRIFEKFFRLPPAVSGDGRSHARGVGIGLYMCRQIVELHGGRIRCDAGPGGTGARFIIDLPCAAGSRAIEPAATAPLAPTRR